MKRFLCSRPWPALCPLRADQQRTATRSPCAAAAAATPRHPTLLADRRAPHRQRADQTEYGLLDWLAGPCGEGRSVLHGAPTLLVTTSSTPVASERAPVRTLRRLRRPRSLGHGTGRTWSRALGRARGGTTLRTRPRSRSSVRIPHPP